MDEVGGDLLERVDIFKDIAERTGGDIYLGAVSYTHLTLPTMAVV